MSPRESPWYAAVALLTLLRHFQLLALRESFDVIWENAPNPSIIQAVDYKATQQHRGPVD